MKKGSVQWIRSLILDLAGHAAEMGECDLPAKEEGDVDVTVYRTPGEQWGVSIISNEDELVILKINVSAEPGPLERSGQVEEGMSIMAINGEWNRPLSFEVKRTQIIDAHGFVTFRFRKEEFMSEKFRESLDEYRADQARKLKYQAESADYEENEDVEDDDTASVDATLSARLEARDIELETAADQPIDSSKGDDMEVESQGQGNGKPVLGGFDTDGAQEEKAMEGGGEDRQRRQGAQGVTTKEAVQIDMPLEVSKKVTAESSGQEAAGKAAGGDPVQPPSATAPSALVSKAVQEATGKKGSEKVVSSQKAEERLSKLSPITAPAPVSRVEEAKGEKDDKEVESSKQKLDVVSSRKADMILVRGTSLCGHRRHEPLLLEAVQGKATDNGIKTITALTPQPKLTEEYAMDIEVSNKENEQAVKSIPPDEAATPFPPQKSTIPEGSLEEGPGVGDGKVTGGEVSSGQEGNAPKDSVSTQKSTIPEGSLEEGPGVGNGKVTAGEVSSGQKGNAPKDSVSKEDALQRKPEAARADGMDVDGQGDGQRHSKRLDGTLPGNKGGVGEASAAVGQPKSNPVNEALPYEAVPLGNDEEKVVPALIPVPQVPVKPTDQPPGYLINLSSDTDDEQKKSKDPAPVPTPSVPRPHVPSSSFHQWRPSCVVYIKMQQEMLWPARVKNLKELSEADRIKVARYPGAVAIKIISKGGHCFNTCVDNSALLRPTLRDLRNLEATSRDINDLNYQAALTLACRYAEMEYRETRGLTTWEANKVENTDAIFSFSHQDLLCPWTCRDCQQTADCQCATGLRRYLMEQGYPLENPKNPPSQAVADVRKVWCAHQGNCNMKRLCCMPIFVMYWARKSKGVFKRGHDGADEIGNKAKKRAPPLVSSSATTPVAPASATVQPKISRKPASLSRQSSGDLSIPSTGPVMSGGSVPQNLSSAPFQCPRNQAYAHQQLNYAPGLSMTPIMPQVMGPSARGVPSNFFSSSAATETNYIDQNETKILQYLGSTRRLVEILNRSSLPSPWNEAWTAGLRSLVDFFSHGNQVMEESKFTNFINVMQHIFLQLAPRADPQTGQSFSIEERMTCWKRVMSVMRNVQHYRLRQTQAAATVQPVNAMAQQQPQPHQQQYLQQQHQAQFMQAQFPPQATRGGSVPMLVPTPQNMMPPNFQNIGALPHADRPSLPPQVSFTQSSDAPRRMAF